MNSIKNSPAKSETMGSENDFSELLPPDFPYQILQEKESDVLTIKKQGAEEPFITVDLADLETLIEYSPLIKALKDKISSQEALLLSLWMYVLQPEVIENILQDISREVEKNLRNNLSYVLRYESNTTIPFSDDIELLIQQKVYNALADCLKVILPIQLPQVIEEIHRIKTKNYFSPSNTSYDGINEYEIPKRSTRNGILERSNLNENLRLFLDLTLTYVLYFITKKNHHPVKMETFLTDLIDYFQINYFGPTKTPLIHRLQKLKAHCNPTVDLQDRHLIRIRTYLMRTRDKKHLLVVLKYLWANNSISFFS